MDAKYGYKALDWEAAEEETRRILVERASLRGLIPYSDLDSRIETKRMEPDFFALGHMLGEILGGGCWRAGNAVGHCRPEVGDMQPVSGFFELAKKRGRDTCDKTTCLVEELRRVHGS